MIGDYSLSKALTASHRSGHTVTVGTVHYMAPEISMGRYDARVDYAYTSIQVLETQVMFGALFRAVHHWSANLLVVTAFLHLLRVLFTAGYKQGRTMNWLIGIALLLVVLAANFTGYLLPWDQLAYWAVTIGTSMAEAAPIFGEQVNLLLRGAPDIGAGGLLRFYLLHVLFLPLILFLFFFVHYYKVVHFGISLPAEEEEVGQHRRRVFYQRIPAPPARTSAARELRRMIARFIVRRPPY